MVSVAINTTAGPVQVCSYGNVTLVVLNKTTIPLHAYNVSIMLNITSAVLNGNIPVCNLSKSGNGSKDGKVKPTYDHVGALEYILATVMVYSLMGIVSMLVTRIAKRANRAKRRKEQMHENVVKYIKRVDHLRKIGEQQKRQIQVLKVRSALLQYQKSKSNDSQSSSDSVEHPGSDRSRSLASNDSKTDDISVDMHVTAEQFSTTKTDFDDRLNREKSGNESDVETPALPHSKLPDVSGRTCVDVLHVIEEDSENEETTFIQVHK